MSLSTLTQCHPQVCSIHHPSPHSHQTPKEPPPPPDWRRVAKATAIAAIATAFSQFVSTPIDVTTRLLRSSTSTPTSALPLLVQTLSTKGPTALFSGLPLHLTKRLPTKALTVALFELGTQLLSRSSHTATPSTLSAPQHLSVATLSGATALLATYPIHMSYYAIRKGITFATIAARATASPHLLYTGIVPALLGTAPAVLVDYSVYRTLRARIDMAQRRLGVGSGSTSWAVGGATAIVCAAATANMMGGVMSEPFKALSRRMVVDAVQSTSQTSLTNTAGKMLANGVGEFWRGFPTRSVRYVVSAVVSKSTVQHLRGRLQVRQAAADNGAPLFAVPLRRSAPAHLWAGTQHHVASVSRS